jgi:hypothetical protein
MADLLKLADRVEGLTGPDNATDILVEIALFEPDAAWVSVHANAAETKVIYTRADGSQSTHWAGDWTLAHRRKDTAAALRARHNIDAGDMSEDWLPGTKNENGVYCLHEVLTLARDVKGWRGCQRAEVALVHTDAGWQARSGSASSLAAGGAILVR